MTDSIGETGEPRESDGETRSESMEVVKEGLVLDREWFLPDYRSKHQTTLRDAGLLTPEQDNPETGIAGIKYLRLLPSKTS